MIKQISLIHKKIQDTNQRTKKTSNEFDSLLGIALGNKKTDVKKISKSKKLKDKISDKDSIANNTENEDETISKYINPNIVSQIEKQISLPQVQSNNVKFSVEQAQQQISKNAIQTLTEVETEDIKNIDIVKNVNQLISKKTSVNPEANESTDIFDDFVKLNTQQTSKVKSSIEISDNNNMMPAKSEMAVSEVDFLPHKEEKINILQKNQTLNSKLDKGQIVKQITNVDNAITGQNQQVKIKSNVKEQMLDDFNNTNNNISEKDTNKSMYYLNTEKLNDVYNNGNVVIKVSDDAVKTQKPVFNQVAEKILVNYKMGKPQFEMQLFPKNLGKVSVKLTNQNGLMTVEIMAENPKTQDLLVANSGEIRSIIQSAAKQPVQILQNTQDKPWYQEQQNQQNQQSRQNQQEQQERQNRNRVYLNTNDDDVNTEDFISVMQKLKQQSVLM